MTQTNLTYTKAIKNGKLKATEIAVGESVTGTLVDFRENKYGTNNIVLNVNGKEVEIFVAGNLKFLASDVATEKHQMDAFTVITRVEDKTFNGRTVTQFRTTQPNTAATTATAKPTVKQQLDEIRAKRGANGSNA